MGKKHLSCIPEDHTEQKSEEPSRPRVGAVLKISAFVSIIFALFLRVFFLDNIGPLYGVIIGRKHHCEYLQTPSAATLSDASVEISWTATCRIENAAVSFKTLYDAVKPEPIQKGTIRAELVSLGPLESWFKYRAIISRTNANTIEYSVITGDAVFDIMPPQQHML